MHWAVCFAALIWRKSSETFRVIVGDCSHRSGHPGVRFADAPGCPGMPARSERITAHALTDMDRSRYVGFCLRMRLDPLGRITSLSEIDLSYSLPTQLVNDKGGYRQHHARLRGAKLFKRCRLRPKFQVDHSPHLEASVCFRCTAPLFAQKRVDFRSKCCAAAMRHW
jgi:hypothetical protein